MKRDILTTKNIYDVSSCCPGHDTWPNETYGNRRSKAARARDIKKEHRTFRRLSKLEVNAGKNL